MDRDQQRRVRGSAWEPYLREDRRQRQPPEPVSATLWQRLWATGELILGLWRRRDVHGARQLSGAALAVGVLLLCC